MSKQGPIILVDDDKDECELISDSLKKINIPNELICFNNGKKALEYLKTTPDNPFLILCDINMPGMDGLDFRQHVFADPYLRSKSIPFVFLTTSASKLAVREAYELSVQGFFEKGHGIEDIRKQLVEICSYWKQCLHPNSI